MRHSFGAVAFLTARYPNVHYVFAGHRIESGNAAIKAVLKASGADGNAHLLGEPNVIGEAMASGIPCVVTDAGDTTSLVGDVTAIQPIRNAEALGAGSANLMERGAAGRHTIGSRCR